MAKKILIVDDDPVVVQYLEDILKDNGYETCSACDGVQGLEKVRECRPDLITLDMDMPEKGGTMFFVGLRKDEGIKDIPVIVISGVGPRPPVLRRDIPTLTKPVEPDQLLKMVSERI